MPNPSISGESLFAAIFHASPDAIVLVDRLGRVLHANPRAEEMFAMGLADLRSRTIDMLVPGELSLMPANLGQVIRGGTPLEMSIEQQAYARRGDGSAFPVEVSLAAVDGGEGPLACATVRDVTERVAILERSTRQREELIEMVSHELRTPLTSIIGYAELLAELEDDEVSPSARQLLRVIERNADRELHLVDDLLTLAFLDAEEMDLVDDVDLSAIARFEVENAALKSHDRGLAVAFQTDSLCRVRGDELRLAQLTENLVTNAIKFTPAGGSVTVRLSGSGEQVLLEVEDTGIGFTDEEHARIYDRLYRAPAVIEAQIQGAGLGLPIVKAIVEAHGGTIEARSTPGAGSLFSVRLPGSTEPAHAAPAHAGAFMR